MFWMTLLAVAIQLLVPGATNSNRVGKCARESGAGSSRGLRRDARSSACQYGDGKVGDPRPTAVALEPLAAGIRRLLAEVGLLEGHRRGPGRQHQVDDVGQWDVGVVRTLVVTPAQTTRGYL